MHNGDSRWGGSESQTMYFINDHVWLFASHVDGLWYSPDSGTSWTLVDSMAAGHWPGQLYHASSGYYLGADPGIFRSTDGANWKLVPNSGGIVTGLVGDGTTIYASYWASLGPWAPDGVNPYHTSAETDGLTWTETSWMNPAGFKFTQGGVLAYDPVHHILYSSNGTQGFWRIVTQ
jgi:hypothetical protein